MDVSDINAANIDKAVGGTVERDGSILCYCPIHEASGKHSPSLLLSITNEHRILFHCRSQNCDAKHFRAIRDHLIKCGLPRSHVGGSNQEEIHYNYQNPDGSYSWTKIRYPTKIKRKRFATKTWHEDTKEWTNGRPEDAPLLFNLFGIKQVLAFNQAPPPPPLLIVEGEKDVFTAGHLGMLATTSADGAGSWRVEDTRI